MQIKRTALISQTSSKLGQIVPRTAELVALELVEKSSKTYNEKSCHYLASFFLIRSSSLMQVIRTIIRVQMSSKFDKFRPRTAELAALERILIRSHLFLSVTRTTIISHTI